MIVGKRIFITGGAGYLGKNLIKKWNLHNDITVFSRDEAKHYFLQKEFPNVKFIVGDIRNFDLLKRSSKNHDLAVFAASLKQIEACESNYEEAMEVIVRGAFNSKKVAVDNDMEAACFVSTDKSICPTTIYGLCKGLAGESFIENNYETNCKLNTVIYGNIANSTGSVIPLIWQYINNKNKLSLYGEDMTRFLLSVDDAIETIEYALEGPYINSNIIPQAFSFRIKDLFDIYKDKFGLKYEITKPRNNEKIHEIMISSEHVARTTVSENNKFYIMKKQTNFMLNNLKFSNDEYSSRDLCITKIKLEEFLEKHQYFKPL